MMSVSNVIKKSVLERLGAGDNLTVKAIILILLLSLIIGLYIYSVYRFSSKNAFYSKDLNVTIAGMPIIVAAIMIAMQTNLIVSLGMVGALSIIRFRTAVKNPLDLLYLFWAMSAGIITGVGLPILALVLCVMMTFLILLLMKLPNYKGTSVLVIRTTGNSISVDDIYRIIKKHSKYAKEKSICRKANATEYIYEIITSHKEALFKALEKEQLTQVNLLDYDGEYRI